MEWKAIPGWPHYEASETGLIRNRATEKVLRQRVRSSDRYLVVDLYAGRGSEPTGTRRNRKTISVHILVCSAFHGERPSPGHEAAHENGQKTENASRNLRWATKLENEADKRRHGTAPVGEYNGAAKISRNQALAIFCDPRRPPAIAVDYAIDRRTVIKIKKRQRWAHLHTCEPMEAAA